MFNLHCASLAKNLYSQKKPPALSRRTRKRLLYMAVSSIHFKCNDSWYVQKAGVSMVASLAVILAIFWFKDYEKVLAMDIPRTIDILEGTNGKCPKYNRSRTFITKAVECEDCLNWYCKDCVGTSDEDYIGISENVWFCK